MFLLNLVQENLLMKNRIVCSLNSACQISIGAINVLIKRPEAEGTSRCLNTSIVTVEKDTKEIRDLDSIYDTLCRNMDNLLCKFKTSFWYYCFNEESACV